MAILNYGNQFKYSGKGYIDIKMAPVNSVEDLETSKSILSSLYVPGMKVTVLNDSQFGAVEYFLNENYEWKRVINLDSLTLSLDTDVDFDENGKKDALLQIHYTNANGELVALGEAIDLSTILGDVESRLDELENKEDVTVEDTNTFVESAELVTEKEGENGLFIKFTYNTGDSFFLDVTQLEPKEYAAGTGILIGEDNIISVDESWFESWFDGKLNDINTRIEALEAGLDETDESVASLSSMLAQITGRVDAHDTELETVKTNISSALSQISENATKIEEVKTTADAASSKAEENEGKITSLAEQLAKIRGVEFIKQGENITISSDEDGYVTISATIPETDLTSIETRLDTVEGVVATHTSDISSLQEAIKNITPDGEGLSGDNVTITTNENSALTVMISANENNVLTKNNDGLFVQGIEIILGDVEINAEE